MPVTFWTFVIYTLAIAGVPLTAGFMSKDEILAGTMAFGGLTGHVLIPVIGFTVAGLTAFYMFRLVILTFLGRPADAERLRAVHESPKVMTVPLVILAALSIFIFYGVNPFQPSETWVERFNERPETVVPASARRAADGRVQRVPTRRAPARHGPGALLRGAGILLAFMVYAWKRIDADRIAASLAPLHRFLLNKWYFDELYNGLVVGGRSPGPRSCAGSTIPSSTASSTSAAGPRGSGRSSAANSTRSSWTAS